jgi:hypothetical protein
MKRLHEYIVEIISPEAIQHRIKHAIQLEDQDELFFYSNLHKVMNDYVEQEARTKARKSHLDYEMCLMQETYSAASQFQKDMQIEDGRITFSKDGFKPCEAESQYIKILKNNLINSSYSILTTKAEHNYYDWSKMKRVYESHTVFKLLHADGTEAIFHEPTNTDESTHLIMFWLPLELQGSFFVMKKRFKETCELLAFNHGLSIYSPCLSSNMKEYPSRQPDRRFDPTPLPDHPDCWRLLKTYLTLGGHLPKLEGKNPHTLFFMHPNKALEAKKVIMGAGCPNPFKYAKSTIYDRSLEKELIG